MAQFSEASSVVLGEEVGEQTAEVLEEPLRLVNTSDDASGEDGQVWPDRIPHPLLECLVEALRPVLTSDLVAVDVRGGEANRVVRSGGHAEAAAERSDEPLEMDIHRGGGKLIHLQSAAAVRGGVVTASVAGVADAEDRPVPGGDIPLQLAVRRHLFRQIDDAVLRNRLFGRELLRVAAEHLSVGADLALEVGESRALDGRWIGEDRNVLVEAVVLLRARQDA